MDSQQNCVFSYLLVPYFYRRFYRWFPNFEERFVKDETGHYQPIHGHEYEMKYRQEMRNKSVEDVTAKRSYAITRRNYEKKNNISRSSSSSNNTTKTNNRSNSSSNSKIPNDIQINTSNITVPSPATTQSEKNKDSFFFNNGNRAPSPLSFLQEPANRVVSEDEEDTILSLVSQTGEEIAASSELKNLNLHLFDEVDQHLMSMMQTSEPMPMMQSYGAMPMMNSYDPMPMMNAYDPMPMSSTMPSMLNSYPAMPMNTPYESMPMNSEYFSSRYSDDSVQGSMGMVSNSSSSSSDASLYLDEHWGTDRDIEDALLLGMGNEVVPTSLR